MKAFRIDSENHITVYLSRAAADQSASEGALVFASEEDLGQAAASWPTARLIQIWNSLPGVTPVKKFTSRSTAVERIWKTMQALEPVARRPSQTAERVAGGKREGTKKAAVLELLRAPQGATVPEIMQVVGWQSHSVRGFLSNLHKAGGAVVCLRRENGARAYQLQAGLGDASTPPAASPGGGAGE